MWCTSRWLPFWRLGPVHPPTRTRWAGPRDEFHQMFTPSPINREQEAATLVVVEPHFVRFQVLVYGAQRVSCLRCLRRRRKRRRKPQGRLIEKKILFINAANVLHIYVGSVSAMVFKGYRARLGTIVLPLVDAELHTRMRLMVILCLPARRYPLQCLASTCVA